MHAHKCASLSALFSGQIPVFAVFINRFFRVFRVFGGQRPLNRTGLALAALCAAVLSPGASRSRGAEPVPAGKIVETFTIQRGELSVLLRGNTRSPDILSGVDSLFHVTAAKDFDAFDPDTPGASAALRVSIRPNGSSRLRRRN
ncbi:MAG: hypothetical protein HY736_00440 [Verrucomicrobia bacterium]|nr:hypothetical protein [Verrucomicrobiota bacterium]